MSHGPLVSVVMIFLNAEPFIGEAIESVLGQTYEDWELLFVDDASSDASSGIARRYAKRYPDRMRYYEHPGRENRGMSASRNLGIRHAKGTFVAFLDADDVWLPHKLEQQVAILESFPNAAMVYGPPLFWYGWTGDPEDLKRDFVLTKRAGGIDTLIEPPTLLPLYLEGECALPFASAILVRREALERVKGYDPRFRGMFEDAVVHAKLLLDYAVYPSSQCWHKYRQHHQGCVTQTIDAGRYPAARVRYLEWLARYLWEHRIRSGETWMFLVRELGPYHHPVWYRLRRLAISARRAATSALPQPVRSRIRAVLQRNRSARRDG